MQIFVIKSHNLVKKSHKTVNFCYKNPQPSYKKSNKMLICVTKS